jgi:hypothetical protein
MENNLKTIIIQVGEAYIISDDKPLKIYVGELISGDKPFKKFKKKHRRNRSSNKCGAGYP